MSSTTPHSAHGVMMLNSLSLSSSHTACVIGVLVSIRSINLRPERPKVPHRTHVLGIRSCSGFCLFYIRPRSVSWAKRRRPWMRSKPLWESNRTEPESKSSAFIIVFYPAYLTMHMFAYRRRALSLSALGYSQR